jgi:glycosyltransferase involved in cell wall biosynthesis
MRVGVIHNLPRGGAHRRLHEHISRLDADVVELCPSTATPITRGAQVVPLLPLAPQVPRALRVPFRYADLLSLLRVWRQIAACLRERDVDVVYANPCRYLQAPAALRSDMPPSLYFCDEPRRVDWEPSVKATRSPVTRPVYEPLYRAERHADRQAVARATEIATNSSYTAGQIQRAYSRGAEVIPMGVADSFLSLEPRAPAHVLSVGALIPSKGHDLAIAALARAAANWPLLVVAPRPDPVEAARLQAVARNSRVRLEIQVGISDGELADRYARAQATLYLAAHEPFGLASLEAQAAGSPVIVAAEGGLPETVGGGWAVPRDPTAVAARLGELERGGVREQMAAAARAHASEMTWEQSARAIQAKLERLCR